jgi:uncharacterized membrane protein YfcA
MVLAGAIRYKLNPDLDIDLAVCGIIAIGGIVGAMIGAQIVFNMPEAVLKRIFAAFIILIGIQMIVKTLPSKPAAKEPPHAENQTERTDA